MMNPKNDISARRLRATLQKLVSLSALQIPALDRRDYEAMKKILQEKDELLKRLNPGVSGEIKKLQIIAGSPMSTSRKISENLQKEIDSLLERLRVQEKHVLRMTSFMKDEIAERLSSASKKRKAAVGYHAIAKRPFNLDTTR